MQFRIPYQILVDTNGIGSPSSRIGASGWIEKRRPHNRVCVDDLRVRCEERGTVHELCSLGIGHALYADRMEPPSSPVRFSWAFGLMGGYWQILQVTMVVWIANPLLGSLMWLTWLDERTRSTS
ncbi:hypothetical protein RIF29_25443 [Crotalaria pallida]|uniref:Uncharacterized protein n=1 Tax=Crotalaria pallida TaxID=3830 RepID=A0AAN9EME8_CROPI